MQSVILAGDVGGTNTRLALFKRDNETVKAFRIRVFKSRDFNGLDEIVRDFLKGSRMPVEFASFGVAGPVSKGRSETPNLAWVIDEHELKSRLGLKAVKLINDLEANAYGIALLGGDDLHTINAGIPEEGGNAAVIAAGTGLGEAGLHREGDRYRPIPSEGGHVDFAPRNEMEIRLFLYLKKEYEHVSYEHILSGPGLYNIYRFLRDNGYGSESARIAGLMKRRDPSSVVSAAALDGSSKLCVQALDLFVSIYGAEAGNLALKFKATGGVYVGGGIAPKIVRKLDEPGFFSAFLAKGRMESMLRNIPLHVILNDKTALLGAAHFAKLSLYPE